MTKPKVEIVPNPKTGHFTYKINGKRVPSVTTVISGNLGWNTRILMAWQAKLFRAGKDPENVSKDACDVGTLVHEMIEHHIYGQDEFDFGEATLDQIGIAGRGLQSYIEWEKANNVEYLESELRMCSTDMIVGGTADAIAMVNGKVTLIDFKTSNRVYGEHLIQLGAYRSMIHETTNYVIEDVMLVRIDKGDLEDESKRVEAHLIDSEIVDEGAETFKQLRSFHETNKKFQKYIKSC
jgi:hypothetical protein